MEITRRRYRSGRRAPLGHHAIEASMRESSPLDRRAVLSLLTGATVGTTLAGCTEQAATYDQWGDVDEIRLESHATGWNGVDPDPIDGETNPTLVLYDGRTYDITIRNGDDEPRSLELRDGAGSLAETYRAGIVSSPGAERTLTVWATPMLSTYACGVRDGTAGGEIDVLSADDTDISEHER